ncbi:MAG: manganese efflux pump MntP family protein [Desulfuromonadaceae bacterium]|nr:manganese efflux pump MntP family protein [Desulfuromonadaceae bacterium]
MDLVTLAVIAVALAMDAFAVALGVGLILPQLTGRHHFRLGFHFGLFQALMPIIGWAAGLTVKDIIAAYDHWIAFGLLTLIGVRMIREALTADAEEVDPRDPTRGMSLVMLSVATSIDALAVGLSLALIGVSIWFPAFVIGITAGGLTVIGLLLGRRIGGKFGKPVEIGGGILLCLIGIKILGEHLLSH